MLDALPPDLLARILSQDCLDLREVLSCLSCVPTAHRRDVWSRLSRVRVDGHARSDRELAGLPMLPTLPPRLKELVISPDASDPMATLERVPESLELLDCADVWVGELPDLRARAPRLRRADFRGCWMLRLEDLRTKLPATCTEVLHDDPLHFKIPLEVWFTRNPGSIFDFSDVLGKKHPD